MFGSTKPMEAAGIEPANDSDRGATAARPEAPRWPSSEFTSTAAKANPGCCYASSAAGGKAATRFSSSPRNGAAAAGATATGLLTFRASSASSTSGGLPNGSAQELTECLLPCDETPPTRSAERDRMRSRADRVASREQGRARRRARRFRAVVRQPEPLRRERVDPGGLRAPERPPAVAAQLAEAEVVDVEEQDVRSISQSDRLRSDARSLRHPYPGTPSTPRPPAGDYGRGESRGAWEPRNPGN